MTIRLWITASRVKRIRRYRRGLRPNPTGLKLFYVPGTHQLIKTPYGARATRRRRAASARAKVARRNNRRRS